MLRRTLLIADSAEELLVEQPTGARRLWIRLFICAAVCSQAFIPLTYYLSDEPTSERFAWRMFSTIHMSRWDCRVIETQLMADGLRQWELPLEAMLEESTVAALRAGQLDYAEKLMRLRMTRPEVQSVRYEAYGILPSGTPLPPIRLELDRRSGVIRYVDERS